MRAAIFSGLILVASAIEAQGNKVEIPDNARVWIMILFLIFFAMDVIEFINKSINGK